MMRYLSVCSGIEAATVAWHPLGWECVGVAEIEKFPCAVLAHHYPHVPNHGDFTEIDTSMLPAVDILCGGTPCQSFSVAGARRSLDDARGNLTLAFVGLAHAIKPRNVVWENVPGVLSTKDNAFGCFLAGLVGADDALPPPNGKRWPNAGMVDGPKGRAAWRVLDAQYFGLAQRRKRVILVADFGNGADPAAVLFEPESVRRDSPPRREAGQGVATAVAPSLTASGRGVERTGDTRGQDPVVAVLRGHSDYGNGVPSLRAKGGDCAGGSEALVAYAPEIARRNATRDGSSQDYESTTMLAVHAIQAGALRENPNSGPDGVGVQRDIAYTLEARAEVQAISVTGPISHALKAEGADASEDGTGRGMPIIAVALRGQEGGATAELGDDCAFALRASSGGGDKPHVLAFQNHGSNVEVCGDITGTLPTNCDRASGGAPMVAASAVRRLTPIECERLQGFPDDYTRIPYRNKPAALCPDGPRYKSLGNSWAVPKFRWLGERIQKHLPTVSSLYAVNKLGAR